MQLSQDNIDIGDAAPVALASALLKTSGAINELATALAKAQGEFPAIPREREVRVATKAGGTYAFKYAPLDVILERVRPVLAKHGLSFIQFVSGSGVDLYLTSRLMHSSGQWIETPAMPVRVENSGPQGMGSGITYAKRYQFEALVGVVGGDDDDGQAAGAGKTTADPEISPDDEFLATLRRAAALGTREWYAAWEAGTALQRRSCRDQKTSLKQIAKAADNAKKEAAGGA